MYYIDLDVLFDRQKRLDPPPQPPEKVLVVGCGGIGSWTTILFALSGTKDFVLVDPDILELSNLARLPFSPYDVGRPKVEVLADFIIRMRPYADIKVFSEPFQTIMDNELFLKVTEDADMIVDAVDRADISNKIVAFGKKYLPEAEYLNPNYDGYSFSIVYGKMKDMAETFSTREPGQGYTIAPSFSGTALFPAVIGLFVSEIIRKDTNIHKNSLKIISRIVGVR